MHDLASLLQTYDTMMVHRTRILQLLNDMTALNNMQWDERLKATTNPIDKDGLFGISCGNLF